MTSESAPLRLPLTDWAQRELAGFADISRCPRIAELDAATLLGERAQFGGYRIPGRTSAGKGSSRLLATGDKRWFALTLSRGEDRETLPALFGDAGFDSHDDDAIAAAVAHCNGAALLEQARLLGLAAALADEDRLMPSLEVLARGGRIKPKAGAMPLVLDLTAVWAGPLAAHLLWQAGAQVVKVENPNRPDRMREGDPELFALLAQGKANVALDPTTGEGRDALLYLVSKADIVIESARPRALAQLGIDATAMVEEQPGLIWINITAQGASGAAANWSGFGHESGVSAGLSAALQDLTGEIGFVGDALPDPLTGIFTARAAWTAWLRGDARRLGISLAGVAAQALSSARQRNRAGLETDLRAWGAAVGQPFPAVPRRPVIAEIRAVGSDNADWLPC